MAKRKNLSTRLVHGGRPVPAEHQVFVNPPLMRGSTVLFPNGKVRDDIKGRPFDQTLNYGSLGNPTHHQLENVIADIEGGTRCQIVSTGLAAATMAILSYARAGDHCLVPDSVYGPVRRFCEGAAKSLNIVTTYYKPDLEESEIRKLIRPNTKIIYAESPGSHTMEIQDIPMLARVVRSTGAKLLMDNTWGIHYFQPFTHGVDCSIQAATKYIAGHSDLLLGSITVSTDEDWRRVRQTCVEFGQYASPDDCWLALRGVRSLEIRLSRHMQSALTIAKWLRARPEVTDVLYPALPGARGHDIWKRDFTGACGLFSVVFDPRYHPQDIQRMVESLNLFGLGASWGGFESLALPSTGSLTRTSEPLAFAPMCRFNIGLEDVNELLEDLQGGFQSLGAKH